MVFMIGLDQFELGHELRDELFGHVEDVGV